MFRVFFCLFLFFFFFLSFIRACVKKLISGSHYRKFCFSFTNVKSYSVDLWVKLKLVPKKGLTYKKLDMFLFFEDLNESWRDQNIRLKFVGFLGFFKWDSCEHATRLRTCPGCAWPDSWCRLQSSDHGLVKCKKMDVKATIVDSQKISALIKVLISST